MKPFAENIPHSLRGNCRDEALPPHTVDCPECGCRTDVPQLDKGEAAFCPRCGHKLFRVGSHPFSGPPAYAAASLILMAFAYSMTYIEVGIPGAASVLSLPEMMRLMVFQDYGFLAEVMFVLTFGAPVLFLLLCLYVYAALIRKQAYPALRLATRVMVRLRQAMMVDVFFVSTLVAYIKLSSVAKVRFGPAFYLMFALSVMLIRTSVSVPQHWVYFQIGRLTGNNAVQTASEGKTCCSRCLYFRDSAESPCGVCGAELYRRRPKSLSISSAFLTAAVVLYFPANILPIMISSNPAATEANTIFSGIAYMWDEGDRLIAAVIFSASILVPVLKIAAMSVLIAAARFALPAGAKKLSHLYRITEAVGRWSMIDIFVIIILMCSFHTYAARVIPGSAAVLMDSAEGIEVNNTVIKVLSIDVGRVTRIKLRDDQKGVEVTAQLNADVSGLIRSDTQFWVVKPRIDQSGVTGLGTLLSGSYIAFTPGKSGEAKDVFQVQDIPPVTAIGQSGLRLNLIGKNDRILNVNSPVLYENFMVGQIESAHFDPSDQSVHYTIFIQSPNDKLIHSASRFWLESGINIETTGSGIKLNSAPLPALLSGAISFDSPKTKNSKNVKSEDSFTLYDSRSEIANLPDDRSLYYTAFFKQSVRGLTVGSPVEYKGLNVGMVSDVPYFDRNDSLHLFENGWIPVRIRIEPSRLEINADEQSKEHWKQQFQTALNKGLTATISSNNLLTGGKMIELNDQPSASPKLRPHTVYAGDTVIATRGGGLDDLQAKLADLLDKFNNLPLDKTVAELNGSLAELKSALKSANAALSSIDKLVGNPQTQNIPNELNQTLKELRITLQGVSPQSPIYGDVQNTLQSLDKTLKDVQPVINTLKEKPNALIFNNSSKDPIPKGSR